MAEMLFGIMVRTNIGDLHETIAIVQRRGWCHTV
jgi:hypothetical protein